MKVVQLTTDLKPWRRGDDAILPDELADKLVASGEGINPRPFNPKEPDIADRQIMQPLRHADGKFKPRRRYLTK
jgi:hypothetical protein